MVLHIGLILPDVPGHCNPGTTLGQALKERGHRVTLISIPAAGQYAKRAGLEFAPLDISEAEQQDIASALEEIARSHGAHALKRTIKLALDVDKLLLREVPSILQKQKFDGLIIDEISIPCGSIAELHNVRFGIISNALTFFPDPLAPPCFTPWQPGYSWLGRLRNTIAWLVFMALTRPIRIQTDAYRRANGLPVLQSTYKEEAPCFWLAQIPGSVDFPYEDVPKNFVHTTPWHKPNRDQEFCTFPWDLLDGRPILYVSLGTIQNRIEELYRKLAEACMNLEEVQLVLSLGRRGATLTGSLPKGAILVDYAPQLQLLEKATALVTHAGMNTALEGLSYGLPMLALPIANDQPGVAARLEYAGAAVVVQPDKATPAALKQAIQRILTDASYRQASEKLQAQIQNGPTLDQAAKLVEIGFARESDQGSFRCDPEVVRIVGEPEVASIVTPFLTRGAIMLGAAVAAFVAWMVHEFAMAL